MGQRIAPSFLDVLLMNKRYMCLDDCKGRSVECKNGGFPKPKDCSQCICPWGFGGKFCDERESSVGITSNCGETIKVGILLEDFLPNWVSEFSLGLSQPEVARVHLGLFCTKSPELTCFLASSPVFLGQEFLDLRHKLRPIRHSIRPGFWPKVLKISRVLAPLLKSILIKKLAKYKIKK
ncbi:unnamed protein product [Meloidogyne enterolobii]|uniref:Uncharacterized protein n=1 Tax=Meloidogyne enterolobii TaxID=390850 RepID=A0ACB0YUG2_MELEN